MSATLLPSSVRRIRRLALLGFDAPWLAEEYGVHQRTIERIINNESWERLNWKDQS